MQSFQSRLIKFIFQIRRLMNPPRKVLDIKKEREETEALAAIFKTRINVSYTPVNVNGVPAEWATTPESRNEDVLLYFHGGSYNSGSIASHRSLVANIANAGKVRALAVDYRMAPEHPFPAAVEDSLAAYRWLLENSISPDHIILAGDSAGGGLAIALLVRLRDEKLPMPRSAVCLSPWTDLTCSGDSWRANRKRDVMLDLGSIQSSAKLYLGDHDPRIPLASPIFADLHGLPPIMIQVGTEELILADATGFTENARAAGVDVTLQVWEGMQHEWQFAAAMLPEGKQAVEKIGQFIQEHLK